MGLDQLVGGSAGPGYKLLCFYSNEKRTITLNNLGFIWDKCCHLTLCVQLLWANLMEVTIKSTLSGIICRHCQRASETEHANGISAYEHLNQLNPTTTAWL